MDLLKDDDYKCYPTPDVADVLKRDATYKNKVILSSLGKDKVNMGGKRESAMQNSMKEQSMRNNTAENGLPTKFTSS